jgi:hypothetical protein
VKLLLGKGARKSITNAADERPHMKAVGSGNAELAALLKENTL